VILTEERDGGALVPFFSLPGAAGDRPATVSVVRIDGDLVHPVAVYHTGLATAIPRGMDECPPNLINVSAIAEAFLELHRDSETWQPPPDEPPAKRTAGAAGASGSSVSASAGAGAGADAERPPLPPPPHPVIIFMPTAASASLLVSMLTPAGIAAFEPGDKIERRRAECVPNVLSMFPLFFFSPFC
jgi:hypothetical protein